MPGASPAPRSLFVIASLQLHKKQLLSSLVPLPCASSPGPLCWAVPCSLGREGDRAPAWGALLLVAGFFQHVLLQRGPVPARPPGASCKRRQGPEGRLLAWSRAVSACRLLRAQGRASWDQQGGRAPSPGTDQLPFMPAGCSWALGTELQTPRACSQAGSWHRADTRCQRGATGHVLCFHRRGLAELSTGCPRPGRLEPPWQGMLWMPTLARQCTSA